MRSKREKRDFEQVTEIILRPVSVSGGGDDDDAFQCLLPTRLKRFFVLPGKRNFLQLMTLQKRRYDEMTQPSRQFDIAG